MEHENFFYVTRKSSSVLNRHTTCFQRDSLKFPRKDKISGFLSRSVISLKPLSYVPSPFYWTFKFLLCENLFSNLGYYQNAWLYYMFVRKILQHLHIFRGFKSFYLITRQILIESFFRKG